MSALEVIALDTATPQLRAPGVGDSYTFPRAVEMPLGTANGVLYLDGSKVVTSGSALTFDGNSTNGLIAFNTTNGGTFSFKNSTNTSGFDIGLLGGSTDNNGYIYNRSSGGLIFAANNSEAMRLTSTGLGIGTSSPAYKLSVNGVIHNNTYAFISQGAQGTSSGLVFSGLGSNYGRVYESGNDLWSLGYGSGPTVAPTAVLSWNSSGNLGLGVTPSAWQSAVRVFEFSGGLNAAALYSGAGVSLGAIGNGYYTSGVFYYKLNGFASDYRQESGAHQWYTALSGNAGDPISFSQAMTLDASGNLLVGSTSGYRNGRLVVKDVNRAQTSSTANLHVSTTDTQAADLGGSIGLGGQVGGDETPFGYISGRKENSTSGNYAGYLAFATQNAAATVVERARIDSSGNFIQTVNTTAATLTTNQTLTFSIVDDSTLRISVRGSDGTTRTATVALT